MGGSMISVAELIDELGYEGSPNFVTGNELGRVPGYGHIFRRAQQRQQGGRESRAAFRASTPSANAQARTCH